MAVEIYEFAVTTPAGTPLATPISTKLTIPAREVTDIHIKVPPGPRGELGFQIAFSGVPVIPKGAGQFVVTDDETIDWQVEQMPDQGDWSVISYNTGNFAHTIHVRLLVRLTQGQSQGALILQPIPPGGLGPGITPPAAPGPLPPLPPPLPPPAQLPPVPPLPAPGPPQP